MLIGGRRVGSWGIVLLGMWLAGVAGRGGGSIEVSLSWLHKNATNFVLCFSVYESTAVSLKDSLSNHVSGQYRLVSLQELSGVPSAKRIQSRGLPS
ncbi:hypothetical protein BDR22DRAFT_401601 [Usnea florida]